MEEWISGDTPHIIEKVLTAGQSYTLLEITAPDGYTVAEDVTFTVNADGSVTEVVMYDAPILKTPTSVPTGDSTSHGAAWVLLGAGILAAMAVVYRRKKS